MGAPRPFDGETIVHKGIKENAGLNITAYFTAYPPPSVIWTFKHEGMNNTQTIPRTNFTSVNVNESVTQSTLVISKISQSEYGNYTAVARAEETAMITFIVGPQRKPFSPEDVSVTCKIHDAIVIWTSSLDGGSPQNFSIKYKSLNDRNYQEYRRVILDKGKGQKINVTVDNLKQASEYVFVVIARNNFGATYSMEMPNCTTGYVNVEQTGSSEALIGGLGGGIGVIFALIVVVVVVIVSRKGKPFGKKTKRASESRSALNENEDEDGLKDNILYESAGPREEGVSGVSVAPVYAEVRKKEQEQNDTNANFYAKVDKEATSQQRQDVAKKGKDKEQKTKGKKGKKDKPKKVQNMDVYENAEEMAMKTIDKDNVYSNASEVPRTTPGRGYKNQDGLLYVEVQFDPEKQLGKPVIHGEDEKTDYATVEFSTPDSRSAP
ncbi:uncharacterized protein LOC133193089 [Saccostrea echinata]|uniref:uncharacterized protein LOC133193089 n=1 Tax=Saccostrea echinata TaxID=191078 RepID=UPI002A7F5602|nr:uncharacterized protein LOC133193089 [Saccostrea echinata]